MPASRDLKFGGFFLLIVLSVSHYINPLFSPQMAQGSQPPSKYVYASPSPLTKLNYFLFHYLPFTVNFATD